MECAVVVTSYSADLDLASALSIPQRCPGCDAASLVPVPAGEHTNFHCPLCRQTWHVELGWAAPIQPPASTNADSTNAQDEGPSCESD